MAAFSQYLKAKLKKWLAIKAETCKNMAPLFSHALDRKLTLSEKIRVKLHIFTCEACLNYVSNLKFMREVFREKKENLENENSHFSLRPEASERIKTTLRNKI